MSETLTIFGIPVYCFGLCAAGAALIYLILTALFGRKKGLPAGTAALLTVLTVPFSVIFARLLFCAVNFAVFTEEFENAALMLRFWNGGLSMAGAVLGCLLAGMLTAKLVKVPFARLVDVMAVPMGLCLALIRFGDKFTDLGTGKSVDESWLTEKLSGLFEVTKMGKSLDYRMAASRYQMIACLVIFAVTLLIFCAMKRHDGHTALMFFALYGAAEVLLESLLDDGHMTIIFLRVEQLTAALMLVGSLIIVCRRYRRAGGAKKNVLLAWLAVAVCTAGVILIEFALDGRLSIGARSMAVNYLFMALCCGLMLAMPCLLSRKAYTD